MSVTYSQTERGFTEATISHHGSRLLTVRASSAITQSIRSHDAIRDLDGDAEPGTSFVWIIVDGPTSGPASAHLDREQASELAGALLRWLATGFLQPERKADAD
jgi:hypothetical protein